MLEILGVPFSAHTRKVLVALHEKEIAFRLVPVVPVLAEGPTAPPPDWPRLSPTKKIPVLRSGEVVVADSSVIGLYLERRFPERSLYPTNPEAYARALWIEEYVDSALQQHVLHGLLAERAFARVAFGREPDEVLIRRSLDEEIPPKLAYLEGQLEGRTFFAGDDFSVADITVASILINYHYAGCELDESEHPRLHRHLFAMLARDCFQKQLAMELPAARQLPTLDLTLVERATS